MLLSSLDAGLRADRQLQGAPVCATCVNTPAAEAGLRDVAPAPTSGEELAGKPAAARCVAPWSAPLFYLELFYLEPLNPCGIVLSVIRKIVVANRELFQLRVPSCSTLACAFLTVTLSA